MTIKTKLEEDFELDIWNILKKYGFKCEDIHSVSIHMGIHEIPRIEIDYKGLFK